MAEQFREVAGKGGPKKREKAKTPLRPTAPEFRPASSNTSTASPKAIAESYLLKNKPAYPLVMKPEALVTETIVNIKPNITLENKGDPTKNTTTKNEPPAQTQKKVETIEVQSNEQNNNTPITAGTANTASIMRNFDPKGFNNVAAGSDNVDTEEPVQFNQKITEEVVVEKVEENETEEIEKNTIAIEEVSISDAPKLVEDSHDNDIDEIDLYESVAKGGPPVYDLQHLLRMAKEPGCMVLPSCFEQAKFSKIKGDMFRVEEMLNCLKKGIFNHQQNNNNRGGGKNNAQSNLLWEKVRWGPPKQAKTPKKNRNNRRDKGRRNQNQNQHQQQMNLPPVESLSKSNNSWAAKFKEAGADEKVKVKRATLALLNKLTPDSKESIEQQFFTHFINNVNDDESTYSVVSTIFEKACVEKTFSNLYADLCKFVDTSLKNCAEEEKRESDNSNVMQLKESFRKSVVSLCQQNFNQKLKLDTNISVGDRQAAFDTAKKKMLGNIKFIGDLYKHNLLHESIIHAIIVGLLDPASRPKTPSEESNLEMYNELEGCCELLRTVGKQIDVPKAKEWINQYFKYLQHFYLKRGGPRIKFMIQDIIELRKSGWVLRREIETVKTKDEIKRQYQKEQNEKASGKRNKRYDNKNNYDNRNDRRGDVRSNNNSNRKTIATIRSQGSKTNVWGTAKSNNSNYPKRQPSRTPGSQDVRGGKYSHSPSNNNTTQRPRSSPPVSNSRPPPSSSNDNNNNTNTSSSFDVNRMKEQFKEISSGGKELADAKLDDFVLKYKDNAQGAFEAYKILFNYYHCCSTQTQKQMLINIRYHSTKNNLHIGALRHWMQVFSGEIEIYTANYDSPHTSKFYGELVAELFNSNAISMEDAVQYRPGCNPEMPLNMEDEVNFYLISFLEKLYTLKDVGEEEFQNQIAPHASLLRNHFNLAPKTSGKLSRRTKIPNPKNTTSPLLNTLFFILGDDYWSRVQTQGN